MDKIRIYLQSIFNGETLSESEWTEFCQEFSLKKTDRTLKTLARLFELCNHQEETIPYLESILSFFSRTGDPDLSIIHLSRFLENSEDPAKNVKALVEEKNKIKLIGRIFAESIYFSEILIKMPDYYFWFYDNGYGKVKNRDEMLAELIEACSRVEDEEEKLEEMRRFKSKEVLRIGANDLMDISGMQTTTGEISNLADVCLEYALLHYKKILTRKHGELEETCRFCVISMGKLGGFELNYSSDIDIIYVCEGNGAASMSGIPYTEFYTQLAQKIMQAINATTAQGYCFRVDTRLRPEGAKGRLVPTLDGYKAYYETRGKTWERQALIKARLSAGDRELGDKFMELITPWVYRKYLTIAEIQAIKHLKTMIETRVTSEGNWKTEVKLGEGGIRDIEFMVQFLQLLNGGNYPELRTQNTLIALSRLLNVKFFSLEEVHFLEDAYIFLRNIEHKLQIFNYQQVHNLPTDPEEIEKIARQLGYQKTHGVSPGKIFEKEYQETTERVRTIFNRNFKELYTDNKNDRFFELIQMETYDENELKIFGEFGFEDPVKVYKLLHEFTAGSLRSRTFFIDILPHILAALSRCPDADMGLVNFVKILEAYRAYGTLFEVFSVHKSILDVFIKLCAYSQFLTDILIQNPGFMDLFTEPDVFAKPKKRTEIQTVLDNMITVGIPFTDALYQLRNMEYFRIGLRNILGLCDIRTTNWELSNLAEVILLNAFHWFKKSQDELKAPCHVDWAFILAGKIGGKELGFGGDIDAVFIYDTNNELKDDYYAKEHFIDIIMNVSNFLGMVTPQGKLYELDFRLRPSGKKSPLTNSLDSMKIYYKEKGEVWEKLFLTKARIIASSPVFKSRVRKTIDNFVFSKIKEDELREKTVDMRKRIAEAARIKNKDKTHLSFKKWYGGLLDIEFLAEYLVILNGRKNPRLRKKNTVAMWNALARYNVIPPEHAETAIEAYKFLRNVENIMRIVHNVSHDFLPEDEKQFNLLLSRLNMEQNSKEDFLQKYNEYTFLIRELYYTYLGG